MSGVSTIGWAQNPGTERGTKPENKGFNVVVSGGKPSKNKGAARRRGGCC